MIDIRAGRLTLRNVSLGLGLVYSTCLSRTVSLLMAELRSQVYCFMKDLASPDEWRCFGYEAEYLNNTRSSDPVEIVPIPGCTPS